MTDDPREFVRYSLYLDDLYGPKVWVISEETFGGRHLMPSLGSWPLKDRPAAEAALDAFRAKHEAA